MVLVMTLLFLACLMIGLIRIQAEILTHRYVELHDKYHFICILNYTGPYGDYHVKSDTCEAIILTMKTRAVY